MIIDLRIAVKKILDSDRELTHKQLVHLLHINHHLDYEVVLCGY